MSRIIVVLGASSAIATAYCRRHSTHSARFVLVGRNALHLSAVAADLTGRGAGAVVCITTDLSDTSQCQARFTEFCTTFGMPDEVMLAYGILGNQETAEMNPEEAGRVIHVNFTSAAVWLQAAAQILPRDSARTLIVIGSVAGDRGRRSNYVYGSAKAGLDSFAEGMAHRLHGTSLHVLTVKPGFVYTPMTTHLDRSGPLWAKPEQIAASIERAVRRKRRVVYTPWFWWPIMVIIKLVPRPLFYRTKL